MPENKHLHFLLIVLYAALSVLGVYLFVRVLFPCLAPFILAYLTAAAVEPFVRYLNKKYGIKRCFSAAVCTLTVFLMFAGILSVIVTRSIYELRQLSASLPDKLSELEGFAFYLDGRLRGMISAVPDKYGKFFLDALDGIADKFSLFPSALSDFMLSFLSSLAGLMPKIFLFVVTYVIGAFMISGHFPEVRRFLIRQIPPRLRPGARGIRSDLIFTVTKWLKAQALLMAVTFVELLIGFIIIGVDYAALFALAISAVDALPIFGTGTILIPWALFSALDGNFKFCLSLIIIYCVTCIVRRLAEPHIVSAQLGLHPVAALISIYAGYVFAGVWGMISFPLALIILVRLKESGILTLWR